jgi:uncharacterized membrane protein YdfJ with MMPL/SSD domain
MQSIAARDFCTINSDNCVSYTMPLILAPSYDDHTREQIENHLSAVRARRMVAAIEHHKGITEKLTYESDKIQARIAKQYEMLGKELGRLEELENKVQERLVTIEALRQELGLTVDMIEIHNVPTEMED